MEKAKYKTAKLIRKPAYKKRKGSALVVASIFMLAMLSITFTIANNALSEIKAMEGMFDFGPAKYNALIAAREVAYFYKHPEYAGDGLLHRETKEGEKKTAEWRIAGVSGKYGALSSKIGDYNAHPYPGSGSAGRTLKFGFEVKSCNVFEQIAGADNETADKYKAFLEKYGITDFSDFGSAIDFSCNWNKIRSFDSAVEIPLYAVGPKGEKIWLKFEEILIKVRTACDEKSLILKDPSNATQKQIAEKKLYDATGMCGKGKRYEMMFDWDISKPKIDTIDYLKNTVLNWGIYSDKGDTNYLIPIKDEKKPTETGDSNIHTKAINAANWYCGDGKCMNYGSPPEAIGKEDFVVLDGETKGQVGYEEGKNLEIKKVLNQSLYKPNIDANKPQINNPILRFTVEQKFKDASPWSESGLIPHLEYQILYKINEIETQQIINAMGIANLDTKDLQIAGKPIFIGTGYSGKSIHEVRLEIIETKTGFDYVIQKP